MNGQFTWRGLTLGGDSPYWITSVTGWEDLPDITVADQARPFRDGDIPRPLYARGRTVTIEGQLHDPDAAGLLVAALQTAAAKSDQLEPLTGTLFGRTLTAQARLLRRSLQQDLDYGVGLQAWALQWSCPDPLRYGPPAGVISTGLPGDPGGLALPTALPAELTESPGSIALRNNGNAGYRPTLQVTGPVPAGGFEIVDVPSGRRLRYENPDGVPAGETVTLDLDRHRVTLSGGTSVRRHRVTLSGGTSVRRWLTVAQWFEVPPGGTVVSWSANDGSIDHGSAARLAAVDPPAGAYL